MRDQEFHDPAHLSNRRVMSPVAAIGGTLLMLTLAAPVNAASTAFVGDLIFVDDSGGGVFQGAMIGDTFAAEFNYGDSASQADNVFIEPDETSWDFIGDPFGAWIGNTDPVVNGFEVNIAVQDNSPLSVEDVAFIDELFGIVVPAGTQVDTWTAAAVSLGAFEDDPDPNDGDDTEILFNGVLWEVVYVDLDGDLYDNLAYRAMPPGLNDVDLVGFFIEEADLDGNTLFEAVGTVDFAMIPVPAAVWLFASALGLGGLFSRRRSQG
ncbi:MAG: hypothetical protein QNJ73_14965 [Gammaproteobacteria bacterium]|nr:hypothetical protein [Gammaproteobacteria bacterium]